MHVLTYTKNPDSTVAEIVVDGQITDQDMNTVIAAMQADLDKGGKLKLLEDVREFKGMEPAAFFKDVRFGLAMMKGVSHVALVTDASWLRMIADTFGKVSPAQIKTFDRAHIDEARSWLAAA
nr:STAS/SEC14 domain-containing protein [Methylobacterium sp. SD274]